MNSRSLTAIVGFSALIALSVMIASQLGGGPERMLIVFLINLTAVLGIGIYSGNSGILSFGHLGFMGIAAYLSGILTMPVPLKQVTLPNLPGFLASAHFELLTASIITVLFVMLVALVIGVVIARLEGSAATIATLALLIIIHGLIIGARDITRGSQSFFGVPRDTDLLAAAIGAVIAIVVARLFRDSVQGLKLRASRDDALAASTMGVNVRRQRLISWVISAGIVAIAGILIGHFLGAFSAKKFYFVDTFMLLAMLIVGGMATVSGAIAGTILITIVTETLRRFESGAQLFGLQLPDLFGTTQIGIGLIILLVMYRKSEGLFGKQEWDEQLGRARDRDSQPVADKNPSERPAMPPQTLDARAITKSFDGLVALDDVDARISSNEIVGLIGPNGSGKTTLLNVLSGVLPVSGGTVSLAGTDLTGHSAEAMAAKGIGRTFQNIRLFESLTVRQNVLISALLRWPSTSLSRAAEIARAAMSTMGLLAKRTQFASNQSYGDQRRVEIARALALQPRFLFLDEPAAGMNREETDLLMDDLRKLKETHQMGILIVDHDLPLITRLCDRVIVLNEGKRIAEGTPAEVQRDPAVIEAYIGRKTSMANHPS